jgi:hypothetical protein
MVNYKGLCIQLSRARHEYSILAGKALEKYLLGKYTRNASAESYVLGCVEADYENSGEKLGRRVCRLDE